MDSEITPAKPPHPNHAQGNHRDRERHVVLRSVRRLPSRPARQNPASEKSKNPDATTTVTCEAGRRARRLRADAFRWRHLSPCPSGCALLLMAGVSTLGVWCFCGFRDFHKPRSSLNWAFVGGKWCEILCRFCAETCTGIPVHPALCRFCAETCTGIPVHPALCRFCAETCTGIPVHPALCRFRSRNL